MKKNRLCILSILLMGSAAHAQTVPTDQTATLKEATAYMNGTNGKPYNPQKGFSRQAQAAQAGSAKAMNALGVSYSAGLGVPTDIVKARAWFEKSGNAGYAQAWFNLGRMYQRALGIDQDFEKAFTYISKAAAAGDADGSNAQAYMLFKGLGCQQDYRKAYQLFLPLAQSGHSTSMYFVGLCLRNGYGIEKNTNAARMWLQQASAKGEAQATEELNLVEPENHLAQPIETNALQGLGNVNSKYHRVNHNATKADLDGSYEGWAIRYDWSGQFIIGRSPLKLELHADGDKNIKGSWQEGTDSDAIPVNSELTDTALLFSNTKLERKDHYSAGRVLEWQFQKAKLQVVKNNDSVYLAGTLQLYSPYRKEPGKPFYVQLAKAAMGNTKTVQIAHATILQTWPNPFSGSSLNIAFALSQQAPVSISVIGMNGQIIYTEAPETLLPGRYTRNIQVQQAAAGTYLVKLNYGHQFATAKIVKQ